MFYSKGDQPMVHVPDMAHCLISSGALHPCDKTKLSLQYSFFFLLFILCAHPFLGNYGLKYAYLMKRNGISHCNHRNTSTKGKKGTSMKNCLQFIKDVKSFCGNICLHLQEIYSASEILC